MRAATATATLLVLIAIGACGDGGRGGTNADQAESSPPVPVPVPSSRPQRDETMVSQLDSALAAQGIHINEAGRVARHPAAGFEVYWPSGCGRLRTGEPEIVDPDRQQEFQYACDRFDQQGRGCSVYVLQNGRDENGGPPSPTMVVKHVEAVLEHYGVRAQRQRPLDAAGIEGVEVQAVQPAGKGEVWVRGLLVGPSVYVLTAWNTEGELFDDPEAIDFFASFRLVK
jgi:hypothetical protein